MNLSRRLRDGDGTVGTHQSRYYEVGVDDVVELEECHAVDELVLHLDGDDERLEARIVLLFLDLLNLVGRVDAEYPLDDEHREDDTHNTEGICGCISAGHGIGSVGSLGDGCDSLLGSSETGSVGDGTAHDADESDDVVDVTEEVHSENDDDVEDDAEDREHVELDTALLER